MAEQNFPDNRVLYGDDCLNVLNDELALPRGSVDLIYLDPPFNSQSVYNLPFAGKDHDARPVEAFNDTWTWGDREDELLQELSGGPLSRNLADIITLAQRLDRMLWGRGRPPLQLGGIPIEYGGTADSHAWGACRHRLHLSALRPHGKPLPQTRHGCHLWPTELPQRDSVVLSRRRSVTAIFPEEARCPIAIWENRIPLAT